MSTATALPTVREFYLETFCPTHLANACQKSQRKYLRVIERAGDFLGRELQFDDLSDALTSGLTEFLVGNGMKPDSAADFRQCLRALANDAQKRGYATGWVSSVDPLAQGAGRGNRRQHFKRDMRGPQGRTRRMMVKAASLFAAGHAFEAIAGRLGVAAETIHTWRRRYRAVWDAAYKSATQSVIESVRQEAAKRCEKIREAAYLRRAWAAERALAQQGETLVHTGNVLEPDGLLPAGYKYPAKYTVAHWSSVIMAGAGAVLAGTCIAGWLLG